MHLTTGNSLGKYFNRLRNPIYEAKKIYAVACLPSNKLSEMISDIVPQEDIVLTL